jgi:hypothetical protein
MSRSSQTSTNKTSLYDVLFVESNVFRDSVSQALQHSIQKRFANSMDQMHIFANDFLLRGYMQKWASLLKEDLETALRDIAMEEKQQIINNDEVIMAEVLLPSEVESQLIAKADKGELSDILLRIVNERIAIVEVLTVLTKLEKDAYTFFKDKVMDISYKDNSNYKHVFNTDLQTLITFRPESIEQNKHNLWFSKSLVDLNKDKENYLDLIYNQKVYQWCQTNKINEIFHHSFNLKDDFDRTFLVSNSKRIFL